MQEHIKRLGVRQRPHLTDILIIVCAILIDNLLDLKWTEHFKTCLIIVLALISQNH